MLYGIILTIVVITLIMFLRKFIIKNEELEDLVAAHEKYVAKFSETVTYCTIKMNQIDEKGSFTSDDEIGWWFEEIKTMQQLLNQYSLEFLIKTRNNGE